MRTLMIALLAILLIPNVAMEASATGMYRCDSGDRASWKSMEDLKKKMIAEGWTVRRIKEDGKCYEAYGTSPEGERVEAYFHPVTLEMHLKARRGQVLFRKEN